MTDDDRAALTDDLRRADAEYQRAFLLGEHAEAARVASLIARGWVRRPAPLPSASDEGVAGALDVERLRRAMASLREAFEAGWWARDRAGEHVGSDRGYAGVPIDPTTIHDDSCCASRGCHLVCSHLCGTDLHVCDGTDHRATPAASPEAAASPEGGHGMTVIEGHNHTTDGYPTYPVFRDACPKGCDTARAKEIEANIASGRPNLSVHDVFVEVAAMQATGRLPAASPEPPADAYHGHDSFYEGCEECIAASSGAAASPEQGGLTLPTTTDELEKAYNRGWADGHRHGLDAGQPVIDALGRRVSQLEAAASPGDERLREAAARAADFLDHLAEYEQRHLSHVECGGEPGLHDPLIVEASRLRSALDREAGR